jgi:hypothetical protein
VRNTGTTAVYYSWSRSGRQRLPLAAAAASGDSSRQQGQQQAISATGTCMHEEEVQQQQQERGDGMSCSLFLPQRQGVILPGEHESFR